MNILIKSEYPKTAIPLIDQAKTNIDIMMYQWGQYAYASQSDMQKFNYAIKSASRRGVTVRVLLHPGSPSDYISSKNAATAAIINQSGGQAKFTSRSGVLHAKVLIIDKKIAIIGSHNYSHRSFSSNVEISVLVDDVASIQKLLEYYEILWRQS